MTVFSVERTCALLLLYISSNNYQAFGFWGNVRHSTGRLSSTTQPCIRNTKLLASTTSLAMPHALPRDSYKEGPPDSGEEMQKSLEPLEGKDPIVMTMEELQAKWIDICIEQSRPQDMDAFSLLNVLPLIIREHEYVVLVNNSADAIEKRTATDASSIIYITDQELNRMWVKASLGPMGKPLDAYDAKHALLLLNDEEDELLMGPFESDNDASLLPLAQSLKSDINSFDIAAFEAEEQDGGVEYIITTDVSALLKILLAPMSAYYFNEPNALTASCSVSKILHFEIFCSVP